MFYNSFCGAIQGIEAHIIQVEADVCDGLPMFSIVGLLSSETREAKDRVRISMRNSGFRIPTKHITVNLSPADIRKDGTAFDLAIAMALLAAFGYVPQECLTKTLFIGELSLDGSVRPVNGVLPVVCAAKEKGLNLCVVPKQNGKEASMVHGVQVIGISSLKEIVEYFSGTRKLEMEKEQNFQMEEQEYGMDFLEVSGQENCKRALEIAVSGMHNVLLIGPPGSGKTMLAQRIPSIMPELTFEESLEISKIYSISGLLDEKQAYVQTRPFRHPHHSITATTLVGGGRTPRPGEICLADGGVLFLDELPEFNQNTIEMLRQPLEEKKVTISRLNGSCTYPAKFMMVGAMNPCKCGFFPDRNRCNCSEYQIKNYLGKISMPLLDRMDLCVEAMEMTYKDLVVSKKGESSKDIRKRVKKARKIQLDRFRNENIFYNGEMNTSQVEKFCKLGEDEEKFMEQVFQKLRLSARSYHRILKVARTIADLDGQDEIIIDHLSEAVCYRGLDKKYWGNELWN